MRNRCYKETYYLFNRYGGRGIRVCDRWRDSFTNFYEDIGPRPSKQHSLDRIVNDGNYEPGNVRWATSEEQQNNKSSRRILTIYGASKTLTEWARISGTSKPVICTRLLKYHWTHKESVFGRGTA